MVTIEQKLGQSVREPVIPHIVTQAEQIAERVCHPENEERFSDRRLGRLIGALIAVRRQYYCTNGRLVEEIARYTTSLDIKSPKKTQKALAGIVAELNETNYPSKSIDRFIDTVKNQKLKNIDLKGGV